MQYMIRVMPLKQGEFKTAPWYIGPFATHVAATHFAEQNAIDDFNLIPLDDPAEAPARLRKYR